MFLAGGRSNVAQWLRIAFVGLLLQGWVVQAQLPTATILGLVRDSSGAVVPGVNVTAHNRETGQTRNTTTDEQGSYRLPALPVGNYEVRVSQAGFQTVVQSGVTLVVSQEAVINVTLQVGSSEQTVSVTEDSPMVNTTSAALGGLINETRIADLPLNGRNYIELTLIQPGVAVSRNVNQVAGMSGAWFSTNGAPVRSNNFLLDGAVMQNLYGASSASTSGQTLGVEGIREYRVVTSFFGAEYGMTMGSQMAIVTKSGTNDLHGSLFEYLRNSALDARNFFDTPATAGTHLDGTPRRLPPFQRNNFGGSGGGPIVKDKTFIFGTYEGVRQRFGVTRTANVPPAECHPAPGSNLVTCPGVGTVTVSPVTASLLELFPKPNVPGKNVFSFSFKEPVREDYGQARVDHIISAKDTFFARYTINDGARVNSQNYPSFRSEGESQNHYATLSETRVFSPRILNTFRLSFSRTNIGVESPSGLSGPSLSLIEGKELGAITVTGLTTLTPEAQDPIRLKQNIFTWSDDVFYTRGRHSLKFGTLVNHYQQYMLVSTNSRGSIQYSNLANFLTNVATTYSAITPGSILDRTYHFNTLGFYAQDDFRLHPRLTLNIGLRYEFFTQPQEVRGHGAALRDIVHDAATTPGPPLEDKSYKNFSPRVGFAWDLKGDGKTAVRGGFGLLYDVANLASTLIVGTTATPPLSSQSQFNGSPQVLPLVFPPGSAGKSARTVDYYLPQPSLMQYNLTIERQLPWSSALTIAYAGSRGVNLVRTEEGNPVIPQTDTNGRPFWPLASCPALPASQLNCMPRRNPNWTTIEFKTGGGNSLYNALQVALNKRLSKGLELQGSYTWAKSMDDTEGQLGAEAGVSSVFRTNPLDRNTDRAPSDFDVTHLFRFNAIYRFPSPSTGGWKRGLLGGWWTSGIVSLVSGYPFTPSIGSNRSRSGVNGGAANIDRPDVNPGRNNSNITHGVSSGCTLSDGRVLAAGTPLGTPTLYFDPCAFSLQPAGYLGNAGRNMLRGPGYANVDFSLARDIALGYLGESGKLQFRVEAFNVLNHANFAMPDRTVFSGVTGQGSNPTAGTIITTGPSGVNTPRQIQLALKVLF